MTEAPTKPQEDPRRTRVLDVGGSHVTAAVVVSHAGTAHIESRVDRDIDPHADRATLLDSIARPAFDVDPAAPECVVAMPGPFDEATGVGSFADVGKFGSISHHPLRLEFARRLRIADGAVRFLNDAVAYGIGEWAFGGTGRARRLVCITLGTGVGSAFLHDGTPVVDGPEVPANGYMFPVEVNGGALEDTVSGRSIVAAYAERTGRTSTVADIAGTARAGDEDARAVLHHAMRSLGIALAPWLARFGADELVIGGSISRSWDLLEAPVREGLESRGYVPSMVRRSALLADAPLLGAAEWHRRGSGR